VVENVELHHRREVGRSARAYAGLLAGAPVRRLCYGFARSPRGLEGEAMRTALVRASISAFVLSAACIAMPTSASASDWPMTQGDFWEVTGVHLKDGGGLAYASFLAAEWKADQEFAKSKGWIKGYMVLGNAYARKGEPDIYLIVISERLASGPEADKRTDEYIAWKKKSAAQMQKESGNRFEIREIENNLLLQEWKFK
jgi:hypothetical protein